MNLVPSTSGKAHVPPTGWAAAGLVAGIYVHFLIFAQFGFLQGIRAGGFSADTIHRVLGAMALAGIACSFGAAAVLRRRPARLVGTVGLALGALAGLIAAREFSAPAPAFASLMVIALLTGAGLGAVTVAAAVLIRQFSGGRAIALHVGIGTGLAYLVCNIPAVFTASPAGKAWASVIASLAGLAATLGGRIPREPVYPPTAYAAPTSRAGVVLAALGFLALVWFDSAAFTRVQNAPDLIARFWSGSPMLWTIGTTHLVAAILAGFAIDRGALRPTLAVALVLLAAGHFAFHPTGGGWAAPAYVAGVSLYSTALASFAALGEPNAGLAPGWRAAWIYSLAGWMGSAAGVGLAEQFGRVPAWAAPAAAVVLASSLVLFPALR